MTNRLPRPAHNAAGGAADTSPAATGEVSAPMMEPTAAAAFDRGVLIWSIEKVLPNPLNPREEIVPESLDDLAASIRAKGILSPLLVTPAPRRPGFVHVVAGHRRRAAALAVGLRELPVIVNPFSEQEQLEIMLVENLQREDLSPIEEAKAYRRTLSGGVKRAELSRRIGVPVQRVDRRLELLGLVEEVQRLFHRRELPVALARPLLSIEEPRAQRRMASIAMRRVMTAEQLDKVIRKRSGEERAKPGAYNRPAQTSAPPPPAAARRPLTRSEAGAMLDVGGVASFAAVRRALDATCDACDERNYPEICRACPLPQLVPNLLREVEREGTPEVER